MDMGFPRDQCVEALLFTTSLEQATDYLLSTPPSLLRTPHGGAVAAAAAAVAATTAMDTDGNDEDAVMRAIALSLTADAERGDEVGTSEKELQEHILQGEPLSKQILDHFVQQALNGCLSLLDSLPETVYRVCSLVVAMVHRNGEAYRDSMLASLAKEIGNCVTALQVSFAMSLMKPSMTHSAKKVFVAFSVDPMTHVLKSILLLLGSFGWRG